MKEIFMDRCLIRAVRGECRALRRAPYSMFAREFYTCFSRFALSVLTTNSSHHHHHHCINYSRLNDTQEEHSEEEEEEEEHEDGTFKLCFVLVCSFVVCERSRRRKRERERERF